MSDFKEGYSVVWDKNHKFREQSWAEIKRRIVTTQGGVGVVADDFCEMLRYRGAPFGPKTDTLRDAFADLTRDATAREDIELLSDVLVYMLRNPWSANIEGAWFIYYLEEKNSRDIDLARASSVLNLLHDKNRYAAIVLCSTLSSFIYGEELVIDLLLKTGRLSADLINSIKTIHLNPPRRGERALISLPQIFLSYARADNRLMREIRAQLRVESFQTWSDENLEPGTAEWQTIIERAIEESGAVIVILTPRSAQSVWVLKEIQVALTQKRRIFPMLAEGDENTSVPAALATVQWIDVRSDRNAKVSSLANAIRRYFVNQDESTG
ncbi:MAG TPA: toll/interleukin-1 receptor domain-containing protein [Thermoanaerobaculia bacterium]|nr:toll/interleukin-1 receptor domain-containing protein [Thermoanaerobaculia bacterium]